MKEYTEQEKTHLINRIMRNFDFQKVYRVMVALDWEWMGKKPTFCQIKKKAEELLYRLLENTNNVSCATGGFRAFREGDNIGLLFYVDEFMIDSED